jgi:hypothetical protein
MSLLDTWQRVKDTADQLEKGAPALGELDTFLYYHWVELEVALNPKSPSELEFKKCQQARREILKRVTRFQDQMDKPKRDSQKRKRKEKQLPIALPDRNPLFYLAALKTHQNFIELMDHFQTYFSSFLNTVNEERCPEIISWWHAAQWFLAQAQSHPEYPEYQLFPEILYETLEPKIEDLLVSSSGNEQYARMVSEMGTFIKLYQQTQSSGEGENEAVPVPEEIRDLFPDDEPKQKKSDLR